MAESGDVVMKEISEEEVSDWTEDLSDLILVQRTRVVNLQYKVENKKSLREAEAKLEVSTEKG